jgi:hypothetical protein
MGAWSRQRKHPLRQNPITRRHVMPVGASNALVIRTLAIAHRAGPVPLLGFMTLTDAGV